MAAVESDTIPRPAATYSPELVLVDPDLAEVARASLPASTDTIANLGDAARVRALRRLSYGAEQSNDVEEAEFARRAASWRMVFAVGAGVVVTTVLAASVLHGNGREPEATQTLTASVSDVQTSPTVTAPATTPSPKPQSPKPQSPKPQSPKPQSPKPRSASGPPPRSAPVPRTFAWAPVDRASGYRFELFRESSLVLRRDTRAPRLSVPTRWTFGGKERRLSRGTYRWYVWAVVDGKRGSSAIVQAALQVGATR
jgi:hypothetical protein